MYLAQERNLCHIKHDELNNKKIEMKVFQDLFEISESTVRKKKEEVRAEIKKLVII